MNNNEQLMNSAFVGYEELSRSRRVLSSEASASVDNILRDFNTLREDFYFNKYVNLLQTSRMT